ncbi:phosphoglycolate phosphatase [Pelagibius litoralis]|uniref:phosphoglycolate phosphatase n=1 Tax=Pelagibius litoralis TaxID=374515 RepID=A0A967C4D9_9PROT|nr:phosphoglycolate phosphatase [Pelagibius litoralis]NIA68530.1 phosphoglycolate phosphatase [Pelagibius litoralis]
MTTLRQAVVWDLDGTLIDSAADIAAALNALLSAHDLRGHDVARVRGMIGGGVAKLIERGFAAAGDPVSTLSASDLAPRFLEIYSAAPTVRTKLFPAAAETLRSLDEAGFCQAICTNKPEAVSCAILAQFDILRYFTAVVGGDTTAAKKPDPLPLRRALTLLGVGPEAAVMVGDSAVDVAMARALGMPVAAVTFGYGGCGPADLGADALVDHLDQVPGVLKTLAPASLQVQ